ncbi:MAG: hypothetical protein H6918_05130 [Sphingomonadaceae bacterium]|nr:hypothetical protein [Sphingomonadaceae bacterium]
MVGRVPATPIEAILFDLALAGCKARSGSSLVRQGATIVIELTAHDHVAGEIIWKRKDSFGVRFSRPLSEQLLTSIVHENDLDSSAPCFLPVPVPGIIPERMAE